jgi:pimeloyl-ACP methyl ester carboxylesterase
VSHAETTTSLRLLVLALALVVAGCTADFQDGDELFYVNHKGTSMPVWVTGNWRSNRMIVHIHGGPGTTNAIYYQKESYQRLAEEYGIVYWDQRASGSSHGSHRDLLTMDQWLEDMDVLFTVLEDRYPDAELALMGHSFGGFYGPRWLLEPGRQERVKAWIEQNGAHDSSCKSWQIGVDFVLENGIDGAGAFYRDVWKCDLETNENNQIEEHDGKLVHLWHSELVRKAGGYDVDPERVLTGGETMELLFHSQADLYAVTQNSPLPLEGYYGIDLTPRLGEITIPALVLWGTHDRITPWENAQPGFEAYGAPPEKKRIVLFEDSGHNPWAEEGDKFHDAVSSFLGEVVWP